MHLFRVGLLFALAFALRAIYLFWLAPAHHSDPGEMERAATNLARNGQIGNVFADDSGPSAHVGPIYATILAAIYKVFGPATSRIAQKLFTALIASLTIALMPALARKLALDPGAGWLAGVCLALSPLYWFDETSGSWEQPVASLVMVGLIWLMASLHEQQWQGWRPVLLSGVVLGILALLSPALLAAAGLMWLAEWMCQRGHRKAIILRGAVMLGVAALIVAPWAIRNYSIWNAFIPFRSNFGLELRLGNNPAANGKSSITYWHDPHSPFNSLHPLTSLEERERLRQLGEWRYMQDHQRQAVAWMKENPVRVVELTGRRFVLFWFAPGEIFEPGTSFIRVRTALFSLATLGCLLGFIQLVWRKHPMTWLLMGAITGGSLVYLITHVDMRYRHPIFGLSVLVACEWMITTRAWLCRRAT